MSHAWQHLSATALVLALAACAAPEEAPGSVEEEPVEDTAVAGEEPEGDTDGEEPDGDLAADVHEAMLAYAEEHDWPEVAELATMVRLHSPEAGHVVVVIPEEGEVPLLGDAGPIVGSQCQTVAELETVTVDHTASGGAEIGPMEVPCLDPERPEEYPE